MIKKWGVTLLGVVGITAILLFSLQQIFVKTTLSEQEIINRVESLYNGSVEDITKNARHYNVVFSEGTKVYEVLVDEEQGTFRDLTLLADRGSTIVVNNEPNESAATENEKPNSTEQNDSSPSPSNEDNAIEKPTPSKTNNNNGGSSSTQVPQPTAPPAQPVRITESTATEIALKQFNGEVEDIVFYTAADGGYYIVELEMEEQEAAFQIHAITGKILSVVYDD